MFFSFMHTIVCLLLHPILPVCAFPVFYQLYRIAGGALSQPLIYSGSFEIIELTHLSDGERRNAKRSPGEVPAAPTPNLSCLQIAQSLHHNRWDSCLSFLPCSHIHGHTDVAKVRAVVASGHHAFTHTYPQRYSPPDTSRRLDGPTGRDM